MLEQTPSMLRLANAASSSAIVFAIVTPLLSACSGASPTPALSTSPLALSRNAAPLSPAAKNCKSRLFVSSAKLDYVAVYCTKGHNQAPIEKITDGINEPEGAAVDAKGNFYVTNTGNDTVTEYAPGSVKPSVTYTTDLSYPAGVAIDKNQNVYVTNLRPGSMIVFKQGSNTPIESFTGLTFPIDVALDASGNAYVTAYTSGYGSGEIIEYPKGSSEGKNLGIVTKEPGGITLDKSNDIVTADQGLPGVLVFPPGKTSPKYTFATNAIDPDPVALDKNESLAYVGDSVGNAVYVYDYPSGTLVDTITDGIDGPNGVALDPPAPL
jgi:sugar lactone lactonase YvrE